MRIYFHQGSIRWIHVSLMVVLTIGGIVACDPKKPVVVTTSPKPVIDTSSVGSFELSPPEITAVEIAPVQDSPEGNARLSVRYAEDKRLGRTIDLQIDSRKIQLSRDDKDSQQFNGIIDFDFGTFLNEQIQRQRIQKEIVEVPVFRGRELVRKEKLEPFDPVALRTSIVEHTPIKINPRDFLSPLVTVDAERELMITDISVVEDQTRTFDVCTNSGNPNGAWTFNNLMSNMANQAVTGQDPADFVESWLKTWLTTTTVNFPINERPSIASSVINPWPRLPSGKLDLSKSPMRLLAIVNRIDLRANSVYGGGNAGEGRFVFGVVNRNGGGCSAMPFTVILEYGVPIQGCSAVHSYAAQWMGLGSIALGSPAFNPALQLITDQFSAAGSNPSKPNGSAINQIRTNEIALGAPWELREFNVLASDHQLHLVSTKQTPNDTLNNSPALANFINANATAILADAYSVPVDFPAGQPFLTGATSNLGTGPTLAWNAPGVASDPRHHLSLNTCNACHGSETEDFNFLQITNRNAGTVSQLSKFLLGNGTLAAPSTFTMSDPFVASTTRTFGDLVRRQFDLASLAGSCKASGLLSELNFRPLKMTH